MQTPMTRAAAFISLLVRDRLIQRMRQRGCREVGFGRPGFGSLRDRVFSRLVRTQRRELERLAP